MPSATVEELLAEAQPRRTTVRVLLRQDLLQQHAQLEQELAEAIEADMRQNRDPVAPVVAARLVELEQQIEHAKKVVELYEQADTEQKLGAIVDPDNGYRYVQIRGTVAGVTEAGGDAHIDALAKKYLGLDSYPYRRAGEVRVIFTIAPGSVQTMG